MQCGVSFIGKQNRKFCTQTCMGLSYTRREFKKIICCCCGEAFDVPNSSRKKHCSDSCYNAKRWATSKFMKFSYDTKKCYNCERNLHDNRLFCGMSCVLEFNNKMHALMTLKCEWCNEAFTVSSVRYSGQRFCCDEHMRLSRRNGESLIIQKQCKNCHSVMNLIFKNRKQRFCSLSCKQSGVFNPLYGRHAGSDERATLRGQNVSKGLTKSIVSGSLKPSNHKHDSGMYDSVKMGRIWYRSSYEKRAYEILDADDTVISFNKEPFSIIYEFDKKIKRYVPDIIINYHDGSKKLIEVKPAGMIGLPQNIAKQTAAIKFCADAGIMFECWTEVELGI